MRPACSVEKSARKAEEPDFAAGLLLLPSATLIAVLVNPTNPTIGDPFVRDLEAAASTLGLKLQVLHASTERDFDTVFATLAQLRAALAVEPAALCVRWPLAQGPGPSLTTTHRRRGLMPLRISARALSERSKSTSCIVRASGASKP